MLVINHTEMVHPAFATNAAATAFMQAVYIYIWKFTAAVHFHTTSLELLLHDRVLNIRQTLAELMIVAETDCL
jgi:hypothetical protein